MLYAASGGFDSFGAELARSRDDGVSWETRTRPNIDPIYTMAVEPGEPDTLYAATPFTNLVYRSHDGGGSWVAGPNLARVNTLRVDPRHSRALWAVSGEALYHSDNGSESWQQVPVSSEHDLDFRHLAVNPQNAAIVWLAGSEGLHRLPRLFFSTDGGQSWVRRDGGLGGFSVTAVAIDPVTPSTIFAGTEAGLYRSQDLGASWERLTAVNGPVGFVTVAPTGPSTIWVVAGAQAQVQRSRDGGATWEAASLGLEGAPVLTLEVDPLDPQRLYAGTATRSLLVWSE